MAFAEDLDPYFADFSATATRNGTSTVTGLFDKAYAEAFGMISGSDPVFRCLSSVGMARGNTLLIGGVTYTVVNIEADGTGIDVCRLEAP
jgi:hypothetical protein